MKNKNQVRIKDYLEQALLGCDKLYYWGKCIDIYPLIMIRFCTKSSVKKGDAFNS
jgi:hypothetical protein